ncbi:MAG: molybdopterin molybdotransferase MoeA [Planctomycetes bacterium]|nr:molybdopterin molybdotransferase MoeA [Planctomycetota bacterium]
MMIGVDEAYRIIQENVSALPHRTVGIREAAGHCLAEDVVSDIDMPPYDKSAMDGYAVIAEDAVPDAELEMIENIVAGYVPTKTVRRGQVSKIMTGASVPLGADSVIKVEETETLGTGRVRLLKEVKWGANICITGEDFKAGDLVLKKGKELRPQEIGVLAMVGAKKVKVFSTPRLGIISTGDELVGVNQRPKAGQIRDSNSYSLYAQAVQTRADVDMLGSARDKKSEILSLLKKGLRRNIVLLTGGVSLGEYDIVVDVLQDAGVEIFFHKVALRPGKPIVFGRTKQTLVFGLPGNPVATYVNFELFVRPAIRRMMGFQDAQRMVIKAELEVDIARKRTRREYRPACLRMDSGKFYVAPVEWHGSADLLGATRGNSLLILPEDKSPLSSGDEVDVMVTGEF